MKTITVKWTVTDKEHARLLKAAKSFGLRTVPQYLREEMRIQLRWPKP